MSFQKCPKCDGIGEILEPEMIDASSVEDRKNGFQRILQSGELVGKPCPVCLGEMVIHEDQGVPPSKVTKLIKFDPEDLKYPGSTKATLEP